MPAIPAAAAYASRSRCLERFLRRCCPLLQEAHRGHGLSKAMIELTLRHPKLHGLRSWSLRTRDAHALYAQFGFKPLEHPESYMALRFPEVYRQPTNTE